MTDSLRDKLRARQLRSTTYPLAVADTSEAEAAVENARAAHRLAVLRHDDGSAEVQSAKAKLDEAEAELSECYEHIAIRALPSDEFEALVDAHPAQGEESNRTPWHSATFHPALLAACVDSDMAEDDWAEFFAENASYGDRNGLVTAALDLNTRAPEATVPKGSMRSRS